METAQFILNILLLQCSYQKPTSKCIFKSILSIVKITSWTCSTLSILWDMIFFSPSPWSVCVCVQNVISALMKPDEEGFFERLSSYLTTYTSGKVNYSTQQTSCFWQKKITRK